MLVSSRLGESKAAAIVDSEHFNNIRGPFEKATGSDTARVYRCETGFRGRREVLYLKEYLYRSGWDFVKHIFRKSRGRRAFDAAEMLEDCGIETPEAIALMEKKAGPICLKNLLITREVQDTHQLYDYFGADSGRWFTTAIQKKQFMEQYGRTIGKMHAAGIFHGDLRAGNVLAKQQDSRWSFFLLDNERTRKFRRIPDRLRFKNLVQANMLLGNITNTDRMRFYKAYLKENPDIRNNEKQLAGKVIIKTARRLEGKLPQPGLS